jgi:hypothetical protein
MSPSSMGLQLSIPREMAAKLRDVSSSQEEPEESSSFSNTKKEGPQIAIDLEQLVGYCPTKKEEVETIQSQLLTAMWTRYQAAAEEEPSNKKNYQEPPPDFDVQIIDLLENGVAQFHPQSKTDNTSLVEEEVSSSSLILSYPSQIVLSNGQSKSTHTVWKETCQSPSIRQSFLTKLWNYLAYCSRSLEWKHQMSLELNNLVQQEQTRNEYDEWTRSQRKAKLDQLYSIRETIVHQVDISKEKYEIFVKERETLVKYEMQQHHQSSQQQTSNNSHLAFPDELQWLGLHDAPDDSQIEDDWGLLEDSSYSKSSEYSSDSSSSEDTPCDQDHPGDSSTLEDIPIPLMVDLIDDNDQDFIPDGYKCDSDNDDVSRSKQERLDRKETPNSSLPIDTTELETEVESELETSPSLLLEKPTTTRKGDHHPLSLPFQQRKERRKRAKQRKRFKKESAKRKAEEEQLDKLRQELRQKYTTKDLIIAQTVYEALSKKVETVEELLESLQDEEWEAEEAREQEAQKSSSVASKETPSFSLLDQILAMILGTTPIQKHLTQQEHYKFIQTEHETILKEWKVYFGRLPPSLNSDVPKNTIANQIHFETSQAESSTQRRTRTIRDPSPSLLRQQLGITENAEDDWETNEDCEETAESQKESTPKTNTTHIVEPPKTPKPKVLGLRPGGRIER